jgi:hypothetical protein
MSPDESLQTAIRLALVCPLRLHALTGRGPQTVEHLLHRQIHEAIINALGLTQAGPVALAESAEPADHATRDRSTCPAIICCCFAASDLRAWLNNDRDWTAAASAVGHRLPAAGICAALLGRRIEAVHIDVGYPDTGAIFADLLLNSGDILQLDCRDHVTGYDHALTATSPDDESLDLEHALQAFTGEKITAAENTTDPTIHADGFEFTLNTETQSLAARQRRRRPPRPEALSPHLPPHDIAQLSLCARA